ncbi:methylated-DNA--[protein]-cysteine S-methyltransferase [Ammoniphilus sp. YIM 78166]|uniref:methylated-DNA--[protein]-cysteine S-methyltransferase n=1 Tax=Ammoniphilus sp. YIM 78166 TaxID=1644106 RepID=UPI00106FF4A2|nr:methylated-DNA--[protein]-cysteine S-methyltransferase [Ammoniphilus sp. YIM 78166]
MSRQHSIHYIAMNSPFGEIMIAATHKGVCWISFDSSEASIMSLKRWGRTWLLCDHVVEGMTSHLEDATAQFTEYFQGERTEFTLSLDIYGTPFQKMVWEQLRLIPYGELRTYKDIALGLKAPKAVRAVGGANNRNPLSIVIPCHRVIGSNGALVGYGGGLSIKEYLLQLESSLVSPSARKVQ